jgi:hypothetical protein
MLSTIFSARRSMLRVRRATAADEARSVLAIRVTHAAACGTFRGFPVGIDERTPASLRCSEALDRLPPWMVRRETMGDFTTRVESATIFVAMPVGASRSRRLHGGRIAQ